MVDMSPKSVTVRLKRVSQLRRLCLEMGKARPIERADKSKSSSSEPANQQPAETKH